MSAKRLLPSDTALMNLVSQGKTHSQIASDYGVSRSTVSSALSRAGLTHKVRYASEIPWDVSGTHNHHYDLTMLRIRARLILDMAVDAGMYKRMVSWQNKLMDTGQSVTYTRDRGFFRVPAPTPNQLIVIEEDV